MNTVPILRKFFLEIREYWKLLKISDNSCYEYEQGIWQLFSCFHICANCLLSYLHFKRVATPETVVRGLRRGKGQPFFLSSEEVNFFRPQEAQKILVHHIHPGVDTTSSTLSLKVGYQVRCPLNRRGKGKGEDDLALKQ
jgi:hypothetical protein